MGKNKIDKIDVQKARLKKIFVNMLNLNISIMNFQITLTDKQEEIKGLKRIIKKTEKAIELINSVVHYEILVSIYNSFVNGKEPFYVAFLSSISAKNTVKYWDRTKKGFKEFLKMEKDAKEKTDKEYAEKRKVKETIEKAKKEGKKIEMMYVDGKIKPVIVNEKPN